MRWYRAYYFEDTAHQVLKELSLFFKDFSDITYFGITLLTVFILVDSKTKKWFCLC